MKHPLILTLIGFVMTAVAVVIIIQGGITTGLVLLVIAFFLELAGLVLHQKKRSQK